ncbi:MarR family transcriptional regulator [Sinorhizobium medicae]|uniref:MarR family transcriptional regulator n=1 Tax=Sinorhizobium medicae TaxID=110321 RepID=A0A6G1WFM3_9HYPH|nr:MarR family winged helix-turn-helix transcriptional regulator [Sinorhizobium medicae]MBO1942966.1 winged helix-turn-helix transcriptional regulator [Sinorhizobium medicae]MBO1959459.1 winged helix-turn-helix transcriptional regulator [Sinorhizobium medicae]MDX0405281.1 MarR family transcriptional regulator [Sinorhizobium medicae]MDX0410735.1 MarR family transcriptional regulator [Sinorhizobium medicae]MDX0417161.1 MarR family transcriptional regulator [Sinorhizobium medicae]
MDSSSRTSSGDAFAAFAISVLRLAGHLTSEGDRLAQPSGQTSARWQVLAAARHGNMSVAEAARALGLARQGVQRIADVLKTEDLIDYRENPLHRRAKLIVLTPGGEKVLAEITARQAIWANALGSEIGEERLRQATVLATEIIALFRERGKAAPP